MRDFEKISFNQFKKDVCDDRELYETYKLPTRDSNKTAGYDFYLLQDIEIKPGDTLKIPTGIKSYFESDECLLLVVRSGTGFKYNIRLVNQVGVIDADYYNNPDNEGHMFAKVQNHSNETLKFKAGTAIVQGIFMKYLITKSDIVLGEERRSDY